MKQIQDTSLLVTVAEDLQNEPVLKVWALDTMEKKTGAPQCLSTLSVNNARRQFPVSLVARFVGYILGMDRLYCASDIGFGGFG